MIDLTVLISTVKGLFAGAEKLRELSKKIEQIEVKNAIAELGDGLADLRMELASLKQKVADLEEENVLLKARESSEKPKLAYNSYTFEGDSNHYCPACYDTKGRKHLVVNAPGNMCKVCTVCRLTYAW